MASTDTASPDYSSQAGATPLPRREALVLMDLSSQSLWIECFDRLEKMAVFDYVEFARRTLSHLFT